MGCNVKALQIPDLDTARAAIRRWQESTPGRSGPRHTSDLADVVDLLLATGARIGEILALRWQDLDLTGPEPSVTICGTLVFVKGVGLFRQEWTKTDAGFRIVILPRFAVAMLQRRRAAKSAKNRDAVFCSRKDTWLYPNNVRRQWRQARQDTGLEWVTPHTFRKTVVTILDREGERDAAPAQLGHSSDEVTKTYYIEKATPRTQRDQRPRPTRRSAAASSTGNRRSGHGQRRRADEVIVAAAVETLSCVPDQPPHHRQTWAGYHTMMGMPYRGPNPAAARGWNAPRHWRTRVVRAGRTRAASCGACAYCCRRSCGVSTRVPSACSAQPMTAAERPLACGPVAVARLFAVRLARQWVQAGQMRTPTSKP